VAGELHTEFDRQVDQYRDQMNSGAVKIALELFTKLLTDQEDKLGDVLTFRVKANIALCHYQLGHQARASTLLLDACSYAPDDRRAIANKVLAYILQGDCEKALSYGMQKI
jgi:tetratricopeptide (TPR) repeat protein